MNDPLAYMNCCGLNLGRFVLHMVVGSGTYKGLLVMLDIYVGGFRDVANSITSTIGRSYAHQGKESTNLHFQ